MEMMKEMQLQRYERYKDSGLNWLGEIPEGWTITRFKYLFQEINEKSDDGSGDLLSVSQYTGVTKKSDSIDDGDLITTASTLEGYKKVYKNDLVSNIMLAWNGSLGFSPFNGITSPAYSVYRLNKGNSMNFFHYLVRSEVYKAEFKRNSTGVIESRLRLYTDDFYNIWSIHPPLPEQTAIAAFLDEKTAKIDQAIAQKEKLIALLKERKQILIQELVTGKKVWDETTKAWVKPKETVDSGVEWIGEIPLGWEVKRLKYLGNIVSGYAFPSDAFKSNGVRVLKISNIQTMNIDWSDESFVEEKYFHELPQFRVKEGDLVFALTRPIISTGIKATIIPESKEKLLLNQRNSVLKPWKSQHKFWLYYVILDSGFRQEFNNQIDFTGQQPNISPIDIGNIEIPLPSDAEMQRIIKTLVSDMSGIDKTISLQESQIAQLKEYKSVLIDSAVTGKIRVLSV